MLQPIGASLKPKGVAETLLKGVENKRVREVLERRFGLKTGKRETLEAIGKDYGITRERVRQIEADGLRAIASPAIYGQADQLFSALEEHLEEHGGVAAEHQLLSSVASGKEYPHVEFLLTVGKQFQKRSETTMSHSSWMIDSAAHESVEKILAGAYRELEEKKTPISRARLLEIIGAHAERVLGGKPKEAVILNILGMAKQIGANPFDEYGLVSWPTIRPKGVRDKAYLVLAKAGKPLHFREVAEAINRMKWTKRPAHPQTVHNELIKSGGRFVLVGRGLYALREWGYQSGTVSEVVERILKEAGKPLEKSEIVKRVLAERFVKENTILLNLQNKSLFQKNPEGRYFLA